MGKHSGHMDLKIAEELGRTHGSVEQKRRNHYTATSDSELADYLNGRTRHAVMSKRHRLGLDKQPGQSNRKLRNARE